MSMTDYAVLRKYTANFVIIPNNISLRYVSKCHNVKYYQFISDKFVHILTVNYLK